jgi:hypothetical protein
MLSQDLRAQVLELTPSDRLALIATIVESPQNTLVTQPERSSAIQRMRGLLKTEQPAPSDEEIATMLAERL